MCICTLFHLICDVIILNENIYILYAHKIEQLDTIKAHKIDMFLIKNIPI